MLESVATSEPIRFLLREQEADDDYEEIIVLSDEDEEGYTIEEILEEEYTEHEEITEHDDEEGDFVEEELVEESKNDRPPSEGEEQDDDDDDDDDESGDFIDDGSSVPPPSFDSDIPWYDDTCSIGRNSLDSSSPSLTIETIRKRKKEKQLERQNVAVSEGARKAMEEALARERSLQRQTAREALQRKRLEQEEALHKQELVVEQYQPRQDQALELELMLLPQHQNDFARQRLIEEIRKVDQALLAQTRREQPKSRIVHGVAEIEKRKRALGELRRQAAREELSRNNELLKEAKATKLGEYNASSSHARSIQRSSNQSLVVPLPSPTDSVLEQLLTGNPSILTNFTIDLATKEDPVSTLRSGHPEIVQHDANKVVAEQSTFSIQPPGPSTTEAPDVASQSPHSIKRRIVQRQTIPTEPTLPSNQLLSFTSSRKDQLAASGLENDGNDSPIVSYKSPSSIKRTIREKQRSSEKYPTLPRNQYLSPTGSLPDSAAGNVLAKDGKEDASIVARQLPSWIKRKEVNQTNIATGPTPPRDLLLSTTGTLSSPDQLAADACQNDRKKYPDVARQSPASIKRGVPQGPALPRNLPLSPPTSALHQPAVDALAKDGKEDASHIAYQSPSSIKRSVIRQKIARDPALPSNSPLLSRTGSRPQQRSVCVPVKDGKISLDAAYQSPSSIKRTVIRQNVATVPSLFSTQLLSPTRPTANVPDNDGKDTSNIAYQSPSSIKRTIMQRKIASGGPALRPGTQLLSPMGSSPDQRAANVAIKNVNDVSGFVCQSPSSIKRTTIRQPDSTSPTLPRNALLLAPTGSINDPRTDNASVNDGRDASDGGYPATSSIKRTIIRQEMGPARLTSPVKIPSIFKPSKAAIAIASEASKVPARRSPASMKRQSIKQKLAPEEASLPTTTLASSQLPINTLASRQKVAPLKIPSIFKAAEAAEEITLEASQPTARGSPSSIKRQTIKKTPASDQPLPTNVPASHYMAAPVRIPSIFKTTRASEAIASEASTGVLQRSPSSTKREAVNKHSTSEIIGRPTNNVAGSRQKVAPVKIPSIFKTSKAAEAIASEASRRF